MSHTCHAEGCAAGCPPEHLMCRRHWAMVPTGLKAEVYRTYQPGQTTLNPRPSRDWHRAADAAIAAVRDLEEAGRPASLF